MGHEFTGVVVEVGEGVQKMKVGSRVVSAFTTCCGSCFYCTRRLSARCEHAEGAKLFGWVHEGVGLHGGQAEYVRVPLADSTLIELDQRLTDEAALLLGDVLPTGYYCAFQGGLEPISVVPPSEPAGKFVAVIGCGPVGLMAILSATHFFHTSAVFALDTVPERLELAQKLGARPVLVSGDPASYQSEIFAATNGRGVDVACDAVGTQNVLRTAFSLLRPGGVLSSVGVHTEEAFTGFNPIEGYDKNICYKSGRCPARSFMDILLEKVSQEGLQEKISCIVTHRVPLYDELLVKNAYEIFNNRKENCIKVVFTLASS